MRLFISLGCSPLVPTITLEVGAARTLSGRALPPIRPYLNGAKELSE